MLISERTGAVGVSLARPAAMARSISREAWWVAALTALAAVLRFATIRTQSYWLDEATTVHEMRLSFGALLHSIRVNETTPPLYFAVAWLWSKLFGTGEAGLRSLSAIAGIGLIPLVYMCGRDLVSRRAGMAAAALAAASPYLIWYSQEARSYMLFALLCAASFLYCVRAWRVNSKRNILLWGAFSAGAVLTHFFAGFLVAPEALWLLIVARRRITWVAVLGVVAVQAAVVPLALSDTHHPLNWINAFPLAIRIKQVPVDFAFSSLYQSSIVTFGLVGAGVLAALLVALLRFEEGVRERRGALFAAALAAVVVLAPLVLAELGRDYLVPRNLTPAWVPLAVLLGAAGTASRARPAGAALLAVVLGLFVWAGLRIDDNAQYQRPAWRGVAAALGTTSRPRAIVAYDGGYASQPLAVYLRGIPWRQVAQPTAGPVVSVSEIDVVGSTWQQTPMQLPSGVQLIVRRAVDGMLVERFAIRPAWRLDRAAIGARAGALLAPAPPNPAVLIQHG